MCRNNIVRVAISLFKNHELISLFFICRISVIHYYLIHSYVLALCCFNSKMRSSKHSSSLLQMYCHFSGLVLFPSSHSYLLLLSIGNTFLCVSILLLYLFVQLTRQLAESCFGRIRFPITNSPHIFHQRCLYLIVWRLWYIAQSIYFIDCC